MNRDIIIVVWTSIIIDIADSKVSGLGLRYICFNINCIKSISSRYP